jgi:uncharacterized protein
LFLNARLDRRSAKRPLALLLLTLFAWTVLPAHAADLAPVPQLQSPVTDQTGTLTADQRNRLDQRLRAFEAKKGTQIAVLIVPGTQPESIEQYSMRVVEAAKLGRRKIDDGILLLVARNDRAVRIEVGYGLEGAVPDVLANRIIEQVIVPRFRASDYYGGIDAAVTRLIALIEGEPLPAPERKPAMPSGHGIGSFLPILLMLVFVGGAMLRGVFGSFGGAAVTGGIAGALAWLLTSAAAMAIGAGVLEFIVTLMGGGGGGGWSNRRGWGGGFGGFGGGWGGGGFGGGGGWSGGGGGFGGGGASGRW